MKNLKGKQVLVTGAASGIGLECARAFAKRGANLILSDINVAALEKVRGEIAAMGVTCFAQASDVAREESVTDFATAVQQAAGPVDVLVNNAGVAFLGSFEQTPLSEWRRIYDVNVLGIVHCIRAFLPAMRRAGGCRKIVNVASRVTNWEISPDGHRALFGARGEGDVEHGGRRTDGDRLADRGRRGGASVCARFVWDCQCSDRSSNVPVLTRAGKPPVDDHFCGCVVISNGNHPARYGHGVIRISIPN